MIKPKSNISKTKIFLGIVIIILAILFITLLVIFIPALLSFLLGKLLSSNDGYLLMGLSFNICGSVLILLIPFIIFLLITKKKNKIKELKNFIKTHKVVSAIIISLIIFFEIVVGNMGYIYYKDIKEGPKESIMMDSIVKRKFVYKNSKHTYIIGYIDEKKVKLEITRDARLNVSRNKKYKMVKVKYYDNLKEAFDIDVYISYKEDK